MPKNTDHVDQPTAKPTSKVKAAGAGGASTVVTLGVADLLGLSIDGDAIKGALAAAVIAFIAAYFKRSRLSDR